MKPLMIFILVFLFITGCSKSNEKETTELPSTWKETDHYYSIGGPVIWKQTEASDAEVIQFKDDRVFYSSQRPELNRYIIEESDAQTSTARLKLYEAGKKDTTYWFLKTVTPNTVEIGFSGCIEGCGKRFVSVDESSVY